MSNVEEFYATSSVPGIRQGILAIKSDESSLQSALIWKKLTSNSPGMIIYDVDLMAINRCKSKHLYI